MAGSIMYPSRFEAPITITLADLDAVDLGPSSTGHDRVLHVRADPRAAGAEQRVHLVERRSPGCPRWPSPGPLEDQSRDVPLVSPTYLLSNSGPLMFGSRSDPPTGLLLGDLPGQRCGHRAGDHRLAAAGRPVQQDALGCGSLSRTARRARRATRPRRGSSRSARRALDVGVVGNVEAPPRGPAPRPRPSGSARRRMRPRIHQQGVAGPDGLLAQGLGQPGPPLLVGVSEDRARSPPSSNSLTITISPTRSTPRPAIHVHRLVEQHLLARLQLAHIGGDVDPLAARCTRRRVPSSCPARKTPKPLGGWESRSTSSFRVTIWVRASRSGAGHPPVGLGQLSGLGLQGARAGRRPRGRAVRSSLRTSLRVSRGEAFELYPHPVASAAASRQRATRAGPRPPPPPPRRPRPAISVSSP